PRRSVRACVALALLGGVALLLGLIFEPRSALEALLLASFALVCLSLAGAVIVALLYVTGAGWAAALRRVPEAMALALPVGAAGLAVVLLAAPALYPWAGAHPAEAEATSPLRQLWLDWPFFLGRAAAYLAFWYGFILALVRNSRRQDAD